MFSLTLLVLGSLVARLSMATPTMELEVRSEALDGKLDDLSMDDVKARYNNGTLDLAERSVGPYCTYNTYLATSPTDSTPGDGDPNQNYLDVQVSDNIACTDGGCSVGQESSQSVSIGFSLGTNSNFKPTFFQGGFSVSATWETGNDYTCDGDAGETICIWQRVAHTAYSVAAAPSSPECGQVEGPTIMKSPNNNNNGGGFYCVRGPNDCREQGAQYWSNYGCPGADQTFCNQVAS